MAGSIGNIAKNCTRFIFRGDWAESVGRQCYNMRINKATPTSIFSFDWANAYKDYWKATEVTEGLQKSIRPGLEKAVKDAIKGLGDGASKFEKTKAALKAARSATASAVSSATTESAKKTINELVKKTVKDNAAPGFFTKIGNVLGKIPGAKFVGKNFFPLLIAAQTAWGFISGCKEGGIAEGIKEASRGILKMAGWTIATAIIAATLPVSGIVAMGASFLLSAFVFDKAIDFVLGKPLAEQKAELAQQNQAQQQDTMLASGKRSGFYEAVARNRGRSLGSFGSLTDSRASYEANMRSADAIMTAANELFNKRHDCYGYKS